MWMQPNKILGSGLVKPGDRGQVNLNGPHPWGWRDPKFEKDKEMTIKGKQFEFAP
jgi:hypothetical protein